MNTKVTHTAPFMAFFLSVFMAINWASAEEERLTIYIDADYSITPAPAEAIEIGLRAAFAGTWAETGIAIIPRDHRANARRSLDTIRQAQVDPSAIAVIGGMHSLPYFANGTQINDAEMPLLLPWSAGGMLTRLAEGDANWIFRLSVDDTKAAAKLVAFGKTAGCTQSALLFVDNPWGKGNAKRIQDGLEAQGITVVSSQPLPFNAGEQSITEVTRLIDSQMTDCVYLITGLMLGKAVINEVGTMERPPRVISHWGILGDRLTHHISHETIERVQLSILGSCGLDRAHEHPEIYARARESAQQISGYNFDPDLHAAPHGFFHAHDFGLLILQAIANAQETDGWHSGPKARRRALRDALYQLEEPVDGLLKVYTSPFDPVSEESFDGHEALDETDLCMTSVERDGHLVSLGIE